MDKTTIQTLIDKVIGKKGLIRVPSWWMRKVLMQIADWVQEGDDANSERIEKIKNETDGKISTLETNTNSKISTLESNLNSEISYLKNLSFPYMLVSGTGVVNIGNNEVSFTDADKQLINITGAITFKKKDNSVNDLITYIHISHLDMRLQGRNMRMMFYNCPRLTSLNLSGFDTSAITDMSWMFSQCSDLTSLDITRFDTSAVTTMCGMFSYCPNLTSLDLSSFNTSEVTDMTSMFSECSSLTSLNVTRFDTSAVTNMLNMFYNCSSLTSLDLSSFDTSSVTNLVRMFSGCSSLTSLNLSSFDTSSVTNMHEMFDNCSSLTSLDLSSFDTSSSTLPSFSNCLSLTSLILGPNFFKTGLQHIKIADFSSCIHWTNDTVVTSLVTNSYDRAMAGLKTMTLKLSTNTKAALTDEQKAAITAKGYTIA